MSFTYKQFQSCVYHFKNVADEIEDEWQVCRVPNNDPAIELIYLKKSMLQPVDFSASSHIACLEFNVIYSYSYSVPVLYFYACFDDGKPFSLDEVNALTRSSIKEPSLPVNPDIVSQQEHPYRRNPCFTLHPCRTSQLLEPIMSTSSYVNPLVSWLSIVLPLFGCKIDSRFATATFDGE